MSLTAAVVQLQSIAGGLTGMNLAPNYPPEQANDFPFAISYMESGTVIGGAMGKVLTKGSHNLACEIHVARRDLPSAVEDAAPFLKLLITDLQADPSLNSEIDFIRSMSYTFGAMQYGGIDTIGFRFVLDVAVDEC